MLPNQTHNTSLLKRDASHSKFHTPLFLFGTPHFRFSAPHPKCGKGVEKELKLLNKESTHDLGG
jgi:hypothetical protein